MNGEARDKARPRIVNGLPLCDAACPYRPGGNGSAPNSCGCPNVTPGEVCPVVVRKWLDENRADQIAAHRTIRRLSYLLTPTAGAIKGKLEPLTWHGWADLPKLAAAMRRELAGRREMMHLESER